MKYFTKECECCKVPIVYGYEEDDKDIGKKRLPYYLCWNCLPKIVWED
jgi:hypothetical protein